MAEIVNLRLARKRKERQQRERSAEEARALFGRTRAEVVREQAQRALDEAHHGGHRRDDGDDG